jgi:hypothetical protein
MSKWTAFVAFALIALASCNEAIATKECSPPFDHWLKPPGPTGHLRPVTTLTISKDGALFWNNRTVSFSKLDQILTAVPTLDPQPHTLFEVEPQAPCNEIVKVRNLIEKRLSCRKSRGICGEGPSGAIWDEETDIRKHD